MSSLKQRPAVKRPCARRLETIEDGLNLLGGEGRTKKKAKKVREQYKELMTTGETECQTVRRKEERKVV